MKKIDVKSSVSLGERHDGRWIGVFTFIDDKPENHAVVMGLETARNLSEAVAKLVVEARGALGGVSTTRRTEFEALALRHEDLRLRTTTKTSRVRIHKDGLEFAEDASKSVLCRFDMLALREFSGQLDDLLADAET